MVEAGKLIVLNKFSPVEARVTFLLDALHKVEIDQQFLDDRRKAFLNEAIHTKIEEKNEEGEAAVGHEGLQETSE